MEYALVELPLESNRRVIIKTNRINDFHNYRESTKNKIYRYQRDGKEIKCTILKVAGK